MAKNAINITEYAIKHGLMIIAILLLIFIIWKTIQNYTKQYSIVHTTEIYQTINKIQRSLYYVKTTYTSKAYLPNEKITVDVKLLIADPNTIHLYNQENFKPVVIITDSYPLNDESTTKVNSSNNQLDRVREYLGSSVNINLTPSEKKDVYIGHAEFYYKTSGEHVIKLMDFATENHQNLRPLTIGSSIDMINKRSNDLILVMSLISLMVLLYIEFIKKK